MTAKAARGDELMRVEDAMRLVSEACDASCQLLERLAPIDLPEVNVMLRSVYALSQLAMREHRERKYWENEYRELMASIDKAEREGGEA